MKTRHSRIKGKRRTLRGGGGGWFSSENPAEQSGTSGNSGNTMATMATSVTNWFSELWSKSTNPSTAATATVPDKLVSDKPSGGKRRSKKSASRR